MDLHFADAKPTDEEREAVDGFLGPPESGWDGGERTAADLRWARGGHAARDRRDLLLPALHAVNDRIGWISEGALDYVCRRLTVPPAEGYGVATFYAMFSVKPRPAKVVHVCTDLACAARGSGALTAALEDRLGPAGAARDGVVWQESPCLGLCERAPATLVIQAGSSPTPPLPNSWTPPSHRSAPEGLTGFGTAAPDSVRRAGDTGSELRLSVSHGLVDGELSPTMPLPGTGAAPQTPLGALPQPDGWEVPPPPDPRSSNAGRAEAATGLWENVPQGERSEMGAPPAARLGVGWHNPVTGPQATNDPERIASAPVRRTESGAAVPKPVRPSGAERCEGGVQELGRGGVGEATPRHTTAVVAPATAEAVAAATRAPHAAPPEPQAAAAVPQAGSPGLVLLRRIGLVDPADLDDYRANGGYTALRHAFALGPAGVIREVLDAGLVGRGGAAFPTGRKWEATARQPERTHYLVCNADESEPGTFKDRVLMEGDPYALVEAMTIAGYAIGAHKGFLYLRGEYPRALHRLTHAISQARARGLLGENVLGQGYAFDIEIRRGAGAYICGEETAIFNSIEGRRGEPRSKPPFPVEKGLFGKPTAVNNVETLVNVLPILERGAAAYAATGTGTSTGTKLFCVSGSVSRPGIYELPFGASLRELLDLAGPSESLRAVLLGGAAGGFVRADELDIPLTFEGTRAAGTTLGSGVVLALDDAVELPRILLRIAEFFRDESCGQCVPCRVGTVRQEEALHRIADRTGAAAAADIALLREVGRAMRDASICGLGQTAWNAVESAIDRLGAYE